MPKSRASIALLLLPGLAFADIVWNGKRVDAWPPEAIAPSKTVVAGRATAAVRSGHYPSPKGKIYGLTMLVDFSDYPAPVTISNISDWLNKPGFNGSSNNGSVRDYYLDVSNGQVDFTNEVFGWYRAKKPKSYYEGLPNYDGAAELLKETIAYFDPTIDFSRYDNDKDGTTEAISIVYAGEGQTWAQGLWPHSGWVGQTRDGTKLDRYQMSDMPNKYNLYVFIHECGHMIFGWPDLYYYGAYCSMGNRASDINPVAINDFFRADQGWIPFQDVTALDTAFVTTDADAKVYRYRNPMRPDTEGFVWSYLQNTGRRSIIRGSGLFLQHYDFSISGNSSATKLGLRSLAADGLADLQAEQWPTKSNELKDLFQAATTTSYDLEHFTSALWYDGRSSGLAFSSVGAPGTSLSFRLGPVVPAATPSAILEAEKAQVVSSILKASTDASGGSYVTNIDASASRIVFAVAREKAGACSLVVRFANGGTSQASHTLSINGSTDSVQYRPTGAWGRFDSVLVLANLRAGRNQIVLGRKSNVAELDRIRVSTAPGTLQSLRTEPMGSAFLRRSGSDRLVAPAWMAGSQVHLYDPSGRNLAVVALAAEGTAASGRIPPSLRGLATWICRQDGRIVGQGILPMGTTR